MRRYGLGSLPDASAARKSGLPSPRGIDNAGAARSRVTGHRTSVSPQVQRSLGSFHNLLRLRGRLSRSLIAILSALAVHRPPHHELAPPCERVTSTMGLPDLVSPIAWASACSASSRGKFVSLPAQSLNDDRKPCVVNSDRARRRNIAVEERRSRSTCASLSWSQANSRRS
jgi:hypothetical protein